MYFFLCAALLLLPLGENLAKPTSQNDETGTNCGYQSCPVGKPGMLNLHLVPHSHDDVGWLKTVDQYYYGSNTTIQRAGVVYILDSVVNELIKDKNKKFIYVETAYLWKWWQEQDDSRRHQIKQLINNGQLEIIGGAWSMNDEATTHYHSLIDQFTWGFRRLNDTFGTCARPKIGWQIDPFGHSREMASLMAQFGFDALFFARLDWRDKSKRLVEKTGEMVWRGSPNLGADSDLFTSVLYNHYSAPSGFCFDVLCQDDPIIDEKQSSEYNVDVKVAKFIDYVQKQAKSYKTNNLILTMGDDFNYQDAQMNFKNMDKLIRYINEKQGKVNAFYSTPSCYIKALNEVNQTWPTKTDDFFPYATDPHAYWTGYFTSRPTIKFMERQGNNLLQVCKQLSILGNLTLYPEESPELISLREVMGVMQHHDAITGTEKQHVSDDYAKLLDQSMNGCSQIVKNNLKNLLNPVTSELQLQQCALNISQCTVSENSKSFTVVIYNPSSQKLDKYIRVPVTGVDYTVQDPDGKFLITQILPVPSHVQNYTGRKSNAKNELVFLASGISPLGYKAYLITVSTRKSRNYISKAQESRSIQNKHFKLSLDSNGRIEKMIQDNVEIPLSLNFSYYEGAIGNNEVFENRSSGAYIFRPLGVAINLNPKRGKVYKGPLVEEVHNEVTPWIGFVQRLYANSKQIEVDWVVGPIPIDDGIGKEVIIRVKTDLPTKGVFYTDSNGRELLNRTTNKRETWELDIDEPVAANYYPITSRIVLIANNTRLAVINDRAQGGSSLSDGEVELMLHRRLLHDDAFGVGEALNETELQQGLVARGTTYVMSGTAPEERKFAAQNILAPIIYFAEVGSNEDFQKLRKEFKGVVSSLPENVQILTLEPWKNERILLRLEHILELNEDPVLSNPVCVNIENMISGLSVKSLRETTLGGNQWLEDKNRLKWKSNFNDNLNDQVLTNEIRNIITNKDSGCKNDNRNKDFDIVLNPMQIRTFILDV